MTNRIHKDMNERDRGFTLIELLVVVIIVGILAAIAIPVFLNQRKKAVDASVKADLKNMAIAAETYAADNPSDTDFVIQATNVPVDEVFAKAGFVKTPGNYVSAIGGPADGYCLRVRAITGGSSGPNGAVYRVYDSLQGGIVGDLHTWDVPCSIPGYVQGSTGFPSW